MGVAVLGIVVYRAIPSRVTSVNTEAEKTQTAPQALQSKASHEPEVLSEAPPPFEDSSSSTSKGVAVPTDTSVIGATTPFMAVQLPKAMQRAGARNKRKRRATTKARNFSQNLGRTLPSVESPNSKEPSAA